MSFISWLKLNLRQVLSSAGISFISASVSGVSLVLIQGVFGKEKQGSTTDIALRAIDFLGANRAVLVAIAIWGFSTYFLNNFNERLISRRLEARKRALLLANAKLNRTERRLLTNESHFFSSVIGLVHNLIRTAVFAITLIITSPFLIEVDVSLTIVFVFLICQKRFKQGLALSQEQNLLNQARGQRPSHRKGAGGRRDRDYSENFEIFIKRNWLSAKLDSKDLGILILLITAPFILSDAFSLEILDQMVLFNFTTLLIFFGNSIHLAIHSASFGFRYASFFFPLTFDDLEAEEVEEE